MKALRAVCFTIYVACTLSFAGWVGAQSLDFRCFSEPNGLPVAGVYHLSEDSLGRLLIGTEGGGFVRFDGEKFQVWDQSNGLDADTIRCILPQTNGRIWLGTDGGGLWSFEQDAFTRHASESLRNVEIRSLALTADSTLWIGTFGHGLFALRGQTITQESILQDQNIRALLVSKAGQLIVGSDQGLYIQNNGQFQHLSNGFGLAAGGVLTLYQDRDAQLWAGTEQGAIQFDTKGWQAPPWLRLEHERIRAIAQDSQGDLWFGTQHGAYEWDVENEVLHHYTSANGLSNDRIRNIFVDRSGTLWFSTFFGGICQLTGQSVVHFNRDQRFPESLVTAVTLTPDSAVWFSSFDGGVFRWKEDAGLQRLYQTQTKNQSNRVMLVASGRQAVTAYTEYDGNLDLPWAQPSRPFSVNPRGSQHGEIFAQLEGETLVIAGSAQISGSTFTLLASELGVERFTALANAENLLYIGTPEGVFTFNSELPEQRPKLLQGCEDLDVTALVVDGMQQIWIGTARDGLFRYSRGKLKAQAARDLPDSRVLALSLDPMQDLWVASRKGVTHLELDPTQEFILGAEHFGIEQGLNGQISSKALAWDTQGNLWVGTSRGLFRINPSGKFINSNAPGLQLLDVRIHYENPDWQEIPCRRFQSGLPWEPQLTYDANHLTFDFQAYDLSDPGQIIYQCRLEGYDNDWVDVGSRRSQTYPFLPPGDYVFMLRSRNSSGIWNESPLTFPFSIVPPFYASVWFIGLVVLAFVSLIFLVFRLRLRNLRKKNEVLEMAVAERTKEVRDERDKSDRLLLNILPKETAQELRESGSARTRRYPEATVLFSDLKGFTVLSEQLTPDELVKMLDAAFKAFDRHCDTFGIEKIKTIGDAYMCAAGLPKPDPMHAINMVRFAQAMLGSMAELNQIQAERGLPTCDLRIGIHSGAVITGVVGEKKFAYDIWGDTVNTASRMESSGEVGKINISAATYAYIKAHFDCEARGMVEAKNKGELEMYFVLQERTP
jgi:ligand-binding sensor domain-containing protein/class 3 adenylate cyclase